MAITIKEVLEAVSTASSAQKQKLKRALGIKGFLQDTEFKLGGGALGDMGDDAKLTFDTFAELQRTIGNAGQTLQGEFSQLLEFSKELTGSSAEAARAITGLADSMQSFTFRSAEDSRELAKLGIQLNKLGVGYGQLGEILDTAALGFGKNQEELGKLGRELATIVTAFPGQASQIARNFQQAQSNLAYDSGRIMTVFKKLQTTSSLTGVSFQNLTSAFGESMDTFQGSSEKAGKLNAILGKSVFNSIDLLGRTEGDRVETIIRGVKSNLGGSVNDLGKFQLKAIADGLGLNVEDTRRLLMGQMSADQAIAKATEAKKTPQQIATEKLTTALKDLEEAMTADELLLAFKGVDSPLRRAELQRQTGARAGIFAALRGVITGADQNKTIATTDALVNQIINSLTVGKERDLGDRLKNNMGRNFGELNKARQDKIRAGGFTSEERVVKGIVEELKKAASTGNISTFAEILKKNDLITADQQANVDAKIAEAKKINDVVRERAKNEAIIDPEKKIKKKPDGDDDDAIPGETMLEKFLRLFTDNKIKIEITGLTDPKVATAIIKAAK